MPSEAARVEPVTNSRGQKLALFCWAPASGEDRAVAIVFHGYATHSKYPTVVWTVDFLLSLGIRCYAADMPGHGESEGMEGLLPTPSQLADDGCKVLERVRSLHPGKAVFLAGTSMGGAIALNVARRAEVEGLVLLSPMVKQSDANLPHPAVIAILRWISRAVPWPAVISTNASDPSLQYTDPARRAECESAPQYNGSMRLGTAATLLDTAIELHANLEEVRCPFWAGIGGKEVVVDPQGPEDLFRRAATPAADKVFKRYADAQHALLGEPEPLRQEIEADIRSWLEERLRRRPPAGP